MTSEEDSMTTAELAERAGTTKRTIRYYLAEGLLPPAGGTSARLEFQRDHEVRLRLIQHLQAAGIKLAAVKGILARYSLGEMEGLVEAFDRGEHPSVGDGTLPPQPMVQSLREAPLSLVYGTVREPQPPPPVPPGAERPLLDGDDDATGPAGFTVAEASFPSAPEAPGGLWHRIRLADEVEMLVRAPLDPHRKPLVEQVVAYGLQRLAPRDYEAGTSPAFSFAPAHPAPGGDPVGQPTTPEAQEEAP
jgi:DNA-binding transcriptional MerR regulator